MLSVNSKVNLRRLEYFLAVAEELHFGRAAERLNMAQPPLSRQIMQLEAELDATLFDRGRGQIRLTQAGDALLVRAREVLRSMNDVALEVQCIDRGSRGRLRIAFVGSATHGTMPAMIKSYRAQYPEVTLSLWTMSNAQQYRALIRHDIDIAITRFPVIEDPEVVSVSIQEEPLVLACSSDLLIPPDKPVGLRDFADKSFILYPEQPRPSFSDTVIDLCRTEGFDPQQKVFCQDCQTAIGLVSVNEGVSVVPMSVGQTGHQSVSFIPIDSPAARTGLAVNYRRDNREKHILRFLEVIKGLDI